VQADGVVAEAGEPIDERGSVGEGGVAREVDDDLAAAPGGDAVLGEDLVEGRRVLRDQRLLRPPGDAIGAALVPDHERALDRPGVVVARQRDRRRAPPRRLRPLPGKTRATTGREGRRVVICAHVPPSAPPTSHYIAGEPTTGGVRRQAMQHTVILAGGGTGGHVYPALAMGDALRAHGHTVHYYGDGARLEGRVAPERGYLFRPIEAAQFPRAGLLAKLKFGVALLGHVWKARRQLAADRATLVLGVGGYVMAPTVLAAWTLGVPAAIHESNVSPGLANRLCARVARLLLLTYEETRLPGAAERVVVGCPVNPRILTGSRDALARRYGLDPSRPVLLVVGGSLGAATINAIGQAAAGRMQVVHVTGPRYFAEIAGESTVPAPPDAPAGAVFRPGVAVLPYEDRMADAFAAADLVVCRAGSSTLAELCAVGKPSLLVPSPNVTDNHQEANARGLERAGAARVFVEKGLDVATVVDAAAALLADEPARARMAAAARGLAKPDVAETVAGLIEAKFPG
jgi:UDP-N-acetylglucosamine--N-acetylmuramyl-(pentapeptide) pyrophosphoryl-undecaprenol N-acetylglucosamine transferase